MKSLKVHKILSMILIMMLAVMVLSTVVLAAGEQKDGGAIDRATLQGTAAETGGIKSIGQQIITIVSVIGSIASVVMLIVLGIKYIMGSSEERAEYKKTLLPYCIGAIIVFGISNLLQVVYIVFSELASTI